MNRFLISVVALAIVGCGVASAVDTSYGLGGGYGGYGGYGSYPTEHLGGEGLGSGHGGHYGGLGGHHGQGLFGAGGHYGGHLGYGGHSETYGGHGVLGGSHGLNHGLNHGGSHGSSGQVKALLKGAGRSILASKPELERKVLEIKNNPSVRRGLEKLAPKLDHAARKTRPYLHEAAKLGKAKLAETVNRQNLKQGYQAADGAHLHHQNLYGGHHGGY